MRRKLALWIDKSLANEIYLLKETNRQLLRAKKVINIIPEVNVTGLTQIDGNFVLMGDGYIVKDCNINIQTKEKGQNPPYLLIASGVNGIIKDCSFEAGVRAKKRKESLPDSLFISKREEYE